MVKEQVFVPGDGDGACKCFAAPVYQMAFSGAVNGMDRVTAACMGYENTCVPIVLFVCSATDKESANMSDTTPTMRTIRAEAKATGLPEHFIRQLTKAGKIKCVYAGNRCYLNHDSLVAYLDKGEVTE